MNLKRIVIFCSCALLLSSCSLLRPKPKGLSAPELQAEIEKRGLNYFLEQAHPKSGMVRDWAQNFGPTPATDRSGSIAATGFGLAVVANASMRGMVTREFAHDYTLRSLRFCRDHVPRRKGWFLHFVDWEAGTRMLNSEYSTIDTALYMAGALYAAQILRDQEVSNIVHKLYADLDFQDMLTDGGAIPKKRTLSRAVWEGKGYTEGQWDMYAEQTLLLILGLGHPSHPLDRDAWLAFDRTQESLPNGQKLMGARESLFVHQYPGLFIDFRKFQDGFPNYFENSITATSWHRELMSRDKNNKTLQAGFWGFSAGQSPRGYEGWDPVHYEGIVCIGCTVASVQFLPKVLMKDMLSWYNGPYHDKIWGRYGFVDSLDIARGWYAQQVLGITIGPEYMAFANLNDNTSIWRDFMQIPEIRLGLERASGVANRMVGGAAAARIPASAAEGGSGSASAKGP